MRAISYRQRPPLTAIALLFSAITWLAATDVWGQATHDQSVEERIRARVEARPNDASAWRLLGRVLIKRGDLRGALHACQRAVDLETHTASHHFDLASVLMQMGRHDEAIAHFTEAISLAPDSEYAQQARQKLDSLLPADEIGAIQPVNFETELEPNRFAGTQVEVEPIDDVKENLFFRLDVGTLFNSNIQLAPSNRQAFPGDSESWQVFASPKAEYLLLDESPWTLAATGSIYLTKNLGEFDEYDLQSFQAGGYLQYDFCETPSNMVARLEYNLIHDAFEWESYGTRNGITGSLGGNWLESGWSMVYWSIDYGGFANDGPVPEVTSADGWTHTLGFSHEVEPDFPAWSKLRGGLDVQLANLQGSTYRYNGFFVYTESEVILYDNLWTVLQFGVGYRDYPDFEFSPSRNETVWRAGMELNYELSLQSTATAFATIDQFESDNILFDSHRYLLGIKYTYRQ